MPPKVRYSREDIIAAALAIARARGMEALNARAIAGELGCSTQPLFREFQSMEQIRAEVLERATRVYNGYIAKSAASPYKPYKASGMAYILFAREEPELFKMIFMRDRHSENIRGGGEDEHMDYVLAAVMASTGFDRETAFNFHTTLWVFAHGLATMVATKYLPYDEAQISMLMSVEFEAMLLRFREGDAAKIQCGQR